MEEVGDQQTTGSKISSKRERLMVWVACVLLALVVPIILISFLPSALEHRDSLSDVDQGDSAHAGIPPYTANEDWEGGSITLFDTQINYVLADELTAYGQDLGGPSFVNAEAGQCEILIRKSMLTMLSPGEVAELVGSCLGVRAVTELNEIEAYKTEYKNAYLDACGELFKPLGFGGIVDGDCELPNPESVYKLN